MSDKGSEKSKMLGDVAELAARSKTPIVALGIEGSANKLGVGVLRFNPDGSTEILSNPRKTYITPGDYHQIASARGPRDVVHSDLLIRPEGTSLSLRFRFC